MTFERAPSTSERHERALCVSRPRSALSRGAEPDVKSAQFGATVEQTPASKHPTGMQAWMVSPVGAVQQPSVPQSLSSEQPTSKQKLPPSVDRSLEHWSSGLL